MSLFQCSEDEILVDTKGTGSDVPSFLYTILPNPVRRRVPKLPSLRRSFSGYGNKNMGHTRGLSEDSTASVTPPPSYRSSYRDDVAPLTSESLSLSDDEELEAESTSRPASRGLSGYATPTMMEEDQSGVQWKYASQGYSLLAISAQEASSTTQNLPFSQQLYVHALTYLLRGLPLSLSAEEELSLRAAIPAPLVSATPRENQLVIHQQIDQSIEKHQAEPEASVLHRFVATLTLNVFLIFSFLLPYIQILLRSLYQYDRQHKISERLLSQSLVTADAVGKQSVILASNVCAMNDGKVGEAVREMGVWWVQGVSGGIYEGLGEGMEVLGLGAKGRRRVKDERTTS